jgi:hypothetical protein
MYKTLGKICKTLGEGFAECNIRQESSTNCISATTSLPNTFYRALGKDFTEYHAVLGKEGKETSMLKSEHLSHLRR